MREFTLVEAEAIKPLVRSILKDITSAHAEVAHQRRLVRVVHDQRRAETYAARSVAHQAKHVLDAAEEKLRALSIELEDLGVVLVDPIRGLAGCPFLWSLRPKSRKVRKSLFLVKLWDAPEKRIHSWRFANEDGERQIPAHWRKGEPSRAPVDEVETHPDANSA